MNRTAAYVIVTVVGACVVHAGGLASETVYYSYDPLGRLVRVTTSGGANKGLTVTTDYDPAGNRSNYGATGVGSPPPAATRPPAPPSPSAPRSPPPGS